MEVLQSKLRREVIDTLLVEGLQTMCCAENSHNFARGCRRVISELNKKYSLVLQEFGYGVSDLTQSNLIDP